MPITTNEHKLHNKLRQIDIINGNLLLEECEELTALLDKKGVLAPKYRVDDLVALVEDDSKKLCRVTKVAWDGNEFTYEVLLTDIYEEREWFSEHELMYLEEEPLYNEIKHFGRALQKAQKTIDELEACKCRADIYKTMLKKYGVVFEEEDNAEQVQQV